MLRQLLAWASYTVTVTVLTLFGGFERPDEELFVPLHNNVESRSVVSIVVASLLLVLGCRCVLLFWFPFMVALVFGLALHIMWLTRVLHIHIVVLSVYNALMVLFTFPAWIRCGSRLVRSTVAHLYRAPSTLPLPQIIYVYTMVTIDAQQNQQQPTCLICTADVVGQGVRCTTCKETLFHVGCIAKWADEKPTCPSCRRISVLPSDIDLHLVEQPHSHDKA